MSSAILYLAIIAIWACVLVPRWIRRPHRVLPESDDLTGTQSSAGHSAVGVVPDPVAALVRSAAAGQVSEAEDAWDENAEAGARPRPAADQDVVWHRTQRRSVHIEHPQHQSHPVPGRSRVLQARRRLLTTLVTLLIVALAAAAAKLTPIWTLVPPVGILGLYVLLLREAAVADAEQEQRRAAQRAALAEVAQAEAARADAARLRARRAFEVSQSRPTAEIIDISARVTDQLYDQYADTASRAVGD